VVARLAAERVGAAGQVVGVDLNPGMIAVAQRVASKSPGAAIEWREGSARILAEPQAIDRAHAALRAKYGWQSWLADVLSRITGRIHHRAWIEIRP
jgi:hypothetical protein